MTTLRRGIVGRQSEATQDGQLQCVTERDSKVQGWVVETALGVLHPIKDACTSRVWVARDEHTDTRVWLHQSLDIHHGLDVGGGSHGY